MRLKKLLARYMYKDTATIYRCDEAPDGPVDDYEEVMVYENIPCKLSQYGKDLNFKATDMATEVNENLRMTCNPAYDIQPNDYIVIQHQGQEFRLNASQSFCYPTHQEISLLRIVNNREVGV